MDILRQIEKLQKDNHKSRILMTDIELSMKITMGVTTLTENGSYLKRYEEKLLNFYAVEDEEATEIRSNVVEEALKI